MRQTNLALRVDLNGIDIVELGKFEREQCEPLRATVFRLTD